MSFSRSVLTRRKAHRQSHRKRTNTAGNFREKCAVLPPNGRCANHQKTSQNWIVHKIHCYGHGEIRLSYFGCDHYTQHCGRSAKLKALGNFKSLARVDENFLRLQPSNLRYRCTARLKMPRIRMERRQTTKRKGAGKKTIWITVATISVNGFCIWDCQVYFGIVTSIWGLPITFRISLVFTPWKPALKPSLPT